MTEHEAQGLRLLKDVRDRLSVPDGKVTRSMALADAILRWGGQSTQRRDDAPRQAAYLGSGYLPSQEEAANAVDRMPPSSQLATMLDVETAEKRLYRRLDEMTPTNKSLAAVAQMHERDINANTAGIHALTERIEQMETILGGKGWIATQIGQMDARLIRMERASGDDVTFAEWQAVGERKGWATRLHMTDAQVIELAKRMAPSLPSAFEAAGVKR